MKIIKQCCWCQADMETTRASKKLCSSRCHVQFHRWRQKVAPGAGPSEGFELLKLKQEEKQNGK
ncbi:hypothetical protein [Pseudomonas sp. JUb52]|uniref:hypothetical protein n=1 Tax=Pseudomonas sp. JUb52 TaxID=2485127 RepID=UPI001049C3A0|nr:hypothetical protein [Pseudomonas sp. JUb52]